MNEPKILRIEEGDSQKSFIDKLNSNFSEIFFYGGGFLGRPGKKGISGTLGDIGIFGSFGNPGIRGSTWTVSAEIPGNPIEGDFWLKAFTDPNLNETYRYNGENWGIYEFGVSKTDIFSKTYPVNLSSDSLLNNTGVYISSRPFYRFNLVLSSSGYSFNSYNPLSSKLFISIGNSTSITNTDEVNMVFYKTDYINSVNLIDDNSPESNYDIVYPEIWVPTNTDNGMRTGNVKQNSLRFKVSDNFKLDVGKNLEMSSKKSSIYYFSDGIKIKTNDPNTPLILRTYKSDYGTRVQLSGLATSGFIPIFKPILNLENLIYNRIGSGSFNLPSLSGTRGNIFGGYVAYFSEFLLIRTQAESFGLKNIDNILNYNRIKFACKNIYNYKENDIDGTLYVPLNGIFKNPYSYNGTFYSAVSGGNNKNQGDPSLYILAENKMSSNLISHQRVNPDRKTSLLSIVDTSKKIELFKVLANGETFIRFKIEGEENPRGISPVPGDPIGQPGQPGGLIPNITGNVFIGNSPGTSTSVKWLPLCPAIASDGTVPDINAIYINSGSNMVFEVDPSQSNPSLNMGISIWMPSSSTDSRSSKLNKGWLRLLDSNESIKITLRMKNPNRYFRFLGLNTGSSLNGSPDGTYGTPIGNGQFVDLSQNINKGANTVELTILNLSGSQSRSSSDRWFMVCYSAYNGSLHFPNASPTVGDRSFSRSGILYTRGSSPITTNLNA